MKKKVLIVSYKLGTNSGVGGRRWMLYGKELALSGNSVYFLTAEKQIPDELSMLSVNIRRYDSKGVPFETIKGQGLFIRILRRLYKLALSVITPGTLFDSAKYDKRKVLAACRAIIEKEGIGNVIVTGAPFSLLYNVVGLKKEFKQLNVVCDFRDKWTQGFHYGFLALNQRRRKYEESCEIEVLKNADVIATASPDIEAYLQLKYQRDYVLLYNPISREMIEIADFDGLASTRNVDIFKLVHIGNIHEGCQDYIEKFLEVWCHSSTGFKSTELIFIGSQNKWVNDVIIASSASNVRILNSVDQATLGLLLKEADGFLLFNRSELGKSLPTKLFDYLPFRKPIVTYDNGTELCNFIRSNNLGLLLSENNSLSESGSLLNELIEGDLEFNDGFDYRQMTVKSQAEIIAGFLK
jgi:hypothetical protein